PTARRVARRVRRAAGAACERMVRVSSAARCCAGPEGGALSVAIGILLHSGIVLTVLVLVRVLAVRARVEAQVERGRAVRQDVHAQALLAGALVPDAHVPPAFGHADDAEVAPLVG